MRARAGRRLAAMSVALVSVLIAAAVFVTWRRTDDPGASIACGERGAVPVAAGGTDPARGGSQRPTANAAPPRFEPQRPARFTPAAHREFTARNTSPLELHEREVRDAVWAPAMEAQLAKEIAAHVDEEKLPSTALGDVECRASSCRVELTFAKADVDRAAEAGAVHPVELIIMKVGHLAELETPVELPPGARAMPGADHTVRAMPDGTYRKTVVLTFGDTDIDPEARRAWREEDRKRISASAR